MIKNTSRNDHSGAMRVETIESRAKGRNGKEAASPVATRPARGRKAKPATARAEPAQKGKVSAPKPAPSDPAATASAATTPVVSKLDRLLALLRRPAGATIAELMLATGWQAHSVRGAMAGTLRKKGHAVVSGKAEGGPRRYRIAEAS